MKYDLWDILGLFCAVWKKVWGRQHATLFIQLYSNNHIHTTSDPPIQVSTIGQDLIIHCQHREREGKFGSKVTRQIQRAYHLPAGFDPKSINASFDERARLVIKAAKTVKKWTRKVQEMNLNLNFVVWFTWMTICV